MGYVCFCWFALLTWSVLSITTVVLLSLDRYIDDVLSIAKTHHITDCITFGTGKEKGGQVAFLHILLTRMDNGSIETQVYRKKTHTDRILNYSSNHPVQHKISCLRTLINCIDTHCSTEETKKNELNYLYKSSQKNNYPAHFLDSFCKQKQQN